MSEAVAAAVQAPAVVTPPADQPPAAPREKTFAERWKAHGGEELVDEPADASEPAAPAKAEPQAKVPGAPTAGDKAMFEALAKKLGVKIENGAVKPSERIAWEAAKKRQEDGIAKTRAEVEALKAEAQAAVGSNPKVKRADAIDAALEANDPDAFGAALGFKDFNDLQHQWLKRLADPNYGELRKLQQWKEQQETERVESEKRAKEQQRQQQIQQAERTYKATLQEKAKASANPLVAAMHDDPLFLDAVYRIQKKHWDPEQQKTVSIEEAIQEGLENELRGLYDRLSRGFGGKQPAAPETLQAKAGRRAAPKTSVTPLATTEGGSAPKKPSEMTPEAWRRYAAAKLAEAED